jgi:hypothetical protein
LKIAHPFWGSFTIIISRLTYSVNPPEFEPYQLPEVDLDLPLSDLLAGKVEFPISQVVFHQQRLPISAPPQFSQRNFDIGPALSRFASNLMLLSNEPRGEGVSVCLDRSFLELCLSCQVLLDDATWPNKAGAGSSGSASRSVGLAGATKKNFVANRPDASFTRGGVPVLESQDKDTLRAKAELSQDPFRQLAQSLFLPHHSSLPWRLGMVKQGDAVWFVKMTKEFELDGLRMKTIVDKGDNTFWFSAQHCGDLWLSPHSVLTIRCCLQDSTRNSRFGVGINSEVHGGCRYS